MVFDVKGGPITRACFLGISWKIPCTWFEEFSYSNSHNQVTLFHEILYYKLWKHEVYVENVNQKLQQQMALFDQWVKTK